MPSIEALSVAFVDAAPDYLAVLDPQSRVVFANKAFRNMFLGGRPDEGVDFLSLIDSDSVPRALDAFSNLESESRQVEVFHSTEGRIQPVHYVVSRLPMPEGGLVAMIGRDKTADLELLGEITQLNIELENKQRELTAAYARLEQLAVVDQLTGLYNRHYFFTVVQHFFEEARRYRQPLTCLMMDVDHFKSVNDHYGHMFGDHVLKMVSDRLKASSRRSDLLARFGGEEFILVTPNTDLRTAGMLAERIRIAVEREPATLGSTTANLTISIGLSGTELVPSGALEMLIESADQALYTAKRGGRNRWAVYVPQSKVGA